MNEVLKIIIADDNQIAVDMIKRKIEENEKYKVIGIAKDEEEEIKLIKDIKPNLVITDIRKKNGWTGLDIIKQFENEDNKPIFFVISGSTENYIEEIRTLQIKYYLNKPYNFDDITRILSYIYNDIYPMSIINCKSEITENKYMNFWNKIRKILKRI
jgi:YesN/AraC family two-component response regulator